MIRSSVTVLFSILLLCLSAEAQQKADSNTDQATPRPVSYGLVVDNSGSFRLLIDRVIRLVADIVEANNPDDEAFLVTFVGSDKIVLRQDFTDQKADLQDAAENMFIEGGKTSILDAVKFAGDHLSKHAIDVEGRSRVLVLITDGDDRDSFYNLEQVLSSVKSQKVRVFVIAMSTEKMSSKIPARLAKETGGMVFNPRTKAEMATAVTEISSAMRAR